MKKLIFKENMFRAITLLTLMCLAVPQLTAESAYVPSDTLNAIGGMEAGRNFKHDVDSIKFDKEGREYA